RAPPWRVGPSCCSRQNSGGPPRTARKGWSLSGQGGPTGHVNRRASGIMSGVAEVVGTPQEPDEPRVLPGRAEHALVQELGSKVYETAVSAGWIDAGDPEYGKGTARRSAVDLLTEIGLLQYDPHAKRFIPVDPSAASDLLVVPLAQQGAELLAESARWNDTFSQLGQVFRGSM